jgi:hypothetical protein
MTNPHYIHSSGQCAVGCESFIFSDSQNESKTVVEALVDMDAELSIDGWDLK